ncbi:MAG: hypothetical protein AAFN08_02295 [Cyanobacteria bacterium J06559_3]
MPAKVVGWSSTTKTVLRSLPEGFLEVIGSEEDGIRRVGAEITVDMGGNYNVTVQTLIWQASLCRASSQCHLQSLLQQ